MTKFFTAAICLAAAVSHAADLDFVLVPTGDGVFDVTVAVTGDTADVEGILAWDFGINNAQSMGIDTSAVTFDPAVFTNFDDASFSFRGFPDSSYLVGASGDDVWSVGHNQFNAALPVPGIGMTVVDIADSGANPNDEPIFFDVPAVLGVLSLNTSAPVDPEVLEMNLTAGGTLYGGGDTGSPIAPGAVGVSIIPEPTTAILAALGLVGFATRRR